jgi:hypothetical protein
MRGTQFADQLGADVRLAIRQARKHLSYSLTCMALLAFGLACRSPKESRRYGETSCPGSEARVAIQSDRDEVWRRSLRTTRLIERNGPCDVC